MPTSSTTTQVYLGGLQSELALAVSGIKPTQIMEERFISSGTWVKPDNVNRVEVIVVGGGGGGGASRYGQAGGGGGAGEWRTGTFAVNANVTVTIGNGGAGGVYDRQSGSAGSPSSFGSFLVSDGGEGGWGQASNPIRTHGSTGGCTWKEGVDDRVIHAGGGGGAGSVGQVAQINGANDWVRNFPANQPLKRKNSRVNAGGSGQYYGGTDRSFAGSPNGGMGVDGIAGGGGGGAQGYSYDINYSSFGRGSDGGGDAGFRNRTGRGFNLISGAEYDLDSLWYRDGLWGIPGTGSGGGGANVLSQGSQYHIRDTNWSPSLTEPFYMSYGNTDYRGWRSINDLVSTLTTATAQNHTQSGWAAGSSINYNGENWSWQGGSQRVTATGNGKVIVQPNNLMPYIHGLSYVPTWSSFVSYQPAGATQLRFGWAIYNKNRQLLDYTLKNTDYNTGTSSWGTAYSINTSTNNWDQGIYNDAWHEDAYYMAPIIYVNNVISGSYVAFDTNDSAGFFQCARGGNGGRGIVIVRYALT
jgi:hypothetical protein